MHKKAVKKAAKKPVKRVAKKQAKRAAKAPPTLPFQKPVGMITHFYPNIGVGVVELKNELRIGDKIAISGHGKSFQQKVTSMQVEHEQISVAKKKQVIGMKVAKPVKEKDMVFKLQ